MFDFEKITLQEVAELANTIAVEQGEEARAEFVCQLIQKYHDDPLILATIS